MAIQIINNTDVDPSRIHTGLSQANEMFTEAYASLQAAPTYEPYYWTIPDLYIGAPLANSVIGGADGVVYTLLFHLEMPMTVCRIATKLFSVNGTAGYFGAGIYDVAGNLLTGGTHSPTTSLFGDILTVPAYALPMGVYRFGFMQSTPGSVVLTYKDAFALDVNSVGANLVYATTIKAMGTAANAASTSAMPVTLGTITPISSMNMPRVILLSTAAMGT